MLKYVLIIGGVILLIVAIFFGFIKWLNSSNPEYVVKMLQKNNKSSLVFIENGEVKVDLRSKEMLGLASTVKIMVAMEYAYQVSEGKVDSNEMIQLNNLEKYYFSKLDGGAHEAWIKYSNDKGLIKNDAVSLREVARGMIAFSSNANTEFLMRRLGIDNIEDRMKEAGVKDHSPLFYIESATLIPYEIKLQEYKNSDMKNAKTKIIDRLSSMKEEEWISLSAEIHEKLTKNTKYKEEANVLDWWNNDYDKIFSDRFIQSTTLEYSKLMNQLNTKKFPESVQKEMEYLLGILLENPANQKWIERAGKKGGSTQFILTDALFIEDKNGQKFEIALFFNDLEPQQSKKLMSSLNEFEIKMFRDVNFRKDVIETLNKNF
ncbi:serine hydrolase [Bacillus sp. 31A1R]|uniref:Serine hydrolase n=1 Tax=Robertmurraya mangrovi TaxID=3098077 RepID=A0ABU5IWG2_9BACI|nr:serine hydrolase [Bacillus sp. 31A1R]MDZ5471472.1 serine hydrolase [Bacillus sp. 31A1R]